MQIVEMDIKAVKPYEKNPRKNDGAVDAVAESIKQFGFKVPIVIDSDNVIVCGHTRYKAAKKLKLKNLPCILADDLTPEQIKAYRLADNKVGEIAEWDFELLTAELDVLSEFSFDMTAFTFAEESDHSYIDELLEDDEAMGSAATDNFERDTFNITFVFPNEHEEVIKDYIKRVGKEYVVEMIINNAQARGES